MFPHMLLSVICILSFLYGFFPVHKNDALQIIDPPDSINNLPLNREGLYTPHFDKVVFIVIDGFRNDFLTKDNMPFTWNKIEEAGCVLNVKVECPTVTLPRIKSLTTGGIPQFIDVILNLGNSGSLKESFLHGLQRRNKSIVFYGDDTWLKLFPHMFVRSEGTTSFFVNDFTEVDLNVTRNLKLELARKDWDMLILHYLGLDHIGHVYGPRSPLIPHKLKEMDDVIQLIQTKLNQNESRSLIIITGDHGMKDSGGHGGSTYSETHVPLIVLGTQCMNDSISQTDIPVNLAILLSVNIPSTSIGLVQKVLLNTLSVQQYLFALRYNTIVLVSKQNICHDQLELASKYHSIYLQNNDVALAEKAIQLYENCSKIIHEYSVKTSTQQNAGILLVSIMNLCYIFLDLSSNYFGTKKSNLLDFLLFILVNLILLFNYVVFFAIVSPILGWKLLCLLKGLLQKTYNLELNSVFLLTATIVHPFMLASSSFVEEEHQVWYYVFTTLIFLNLLYSFPLKSLSLEISGWLLMLILFRFARKINQTGDKWSSLPDVADWFLDKDHKVYLHLFLISSLLAVFVVSIFLLNNVNMLSVLLDFCTCLLVFSSYMLDENKLGFQRFVWLLILLKVLLCIPRLYTVEKVWISVCILLLKPYNVILIGLCVVSSVVISRKTEHIATIVLSHLWLGNSLFFTQGHSNSLASVDISVGYTALSSYQPVLVIIQVLFHTYAFPILTHLLLLRNKFLYAKEVWCILLLCRLLVTIVFFTVSFLHRHHIFIWTVFAPKLLGESAQSCVFFVEVLLYYLVIKLNDICKRKKCLQNDKLIYL